MKLSICDISNLYNYRRKIGSLVFTTRAKFSKIRQTPAHCIKVTGQNLIGIPSESMMAITSANCFCGSTRFVRKMRVVTDTRYPSITYSTFCRQRCSLSSLESIVVCSFDGLYFEICPIQLPAES
jgi:hypothetical protein